MPAVTGPYRHVLVESFEPEETSGHHGSVHIRPVSGQVYPVSLFVSCSKRMSDAERYPVGTRFKILAKLTDREGGTQYLYSNPRDPIVVVTAREAATFLAGLTKGRS